jgi:hypothetical protein
MRYSRSITAFALTVGLIGCKKQEKCAATDTPEVCKAFQQCLRSNTSTEVCRMGEEDANRSPSRKPTPQH